MSLRSQKNYYEVACEFESRVVLAVDTGFAGFVFGRGFAQCDIRRSFDAAPHVPITVTSTVSMYGEKLQVGFLLLGDLISSRVLYVFSEYSVPLPVCPVTPQKVWDFFFGARIGVLGQPTCIRMDVGGEWQNEPRAEFCSLQRLKLQF